MQTFGPPYGPALTYLHSDTLQVTACHQPVLMSITAVM